MYQKKMAASIKKISPKRVKFAPENLEEIKEAITKVDIRSLINSGIIKILPARGVSRARAKKRASQRKKGRQKGAGSYKGKPTARLPRKRAWINKIRLQRAHLLALKQSGEIEPKVYRDLYRKAKGGFFRSKRHLNLYMEEHKLRSKNATK